MRMPNEARIAISEAFHNAPRQCPTRHISFRYGSGWLSCGAVAWWGKCDDCGGVAHWMTSEAKKLAEEWHRSRVSHDQPEQPDQSGELTR